MASTMTIPHRLKPRAALRAYRRPALWL